MEQEGVRAIETRELQGIAVHHTFQVAVVPGLGQECSGGPAGPILFKNARCMVGVRGTSAEMRLPGPREIRPFRLVGAESRVVSGKRKKWDPVVGTAQVIDPIPGDGAVVLHGSNEL